MAEFGMNATQLPEASGAGANPIGPATAGPLDNGVGGAINNMLSIFAKGMDLVDKEKAKAKMSPILAEYSRSMGSLASALETGTLKSNEALTRSRALHNRYVASNPELVKEFDAVHGSYFKGSSLNVAEQQEKARIESFNRLKDEARSAGFPIPIDASDDVAERYVNIYQKQKLDNSNFEWFVKNQNEKRSQANFDQAQADRDFKEQSVKLLGVSAQNTLETSEIHLRTLMDQFNKAPDKVGAKNNAIIAWNGWWGTQKAQLAAIASKDPGLAANYEQLFKPIEETGRKIFEEGADPKVLEDELKRQLAVTKLQLVQDPSFRVMAAADGLLKNSASTVLTGTPAIRDATAAVLGRMKGTEIPDFVGKSDTEKVVFKTLEEGITMLQNGKADEATRKDTITGVNNTFKAVNTAVQRDAFSSKDLAQLGLFISKPTFGKFITENQIDPVSQSVAKKVFNQYYEKDVINGVDKQLADVFSKENTYLKQETNSLGGAKYAQVKGAQFTPNDLTVDFSGGSAVFGVKKIPDNAEDRKFYAEQIKALKPYEDQLNRTIRIVSHLNGRTDYEKVWEEEKYKLLPRVYPLRPGTVVNGMKYKGEGDWKDQKNWEKVNTNGG